MDDFIFNGVPYGSVAEVLAMNNMDPGALRPYVGDDGRSFVSRIVGYKEGKPQYKAFVTNAPALLPLNAWMKIDEAIMGAARNRLRVWEDLARASRMVIPDGFGVSVLQTQKMSDFGSAIVSMNPIRTGDRDRPQMDVDNLPLPVTSSDFQFDARDLAVMKRAGFPLDLSAAEAAGRRIAEKVEAMVLGTSSAYSYGSGTIYGYLTFPSRITYTMAIPTGAGWTPADTVADFLAVKKLLRDKKRYGGNPGFICYTSPGWDLALDDDYSSAYGGLTLRDRLKKIEGIADIRTLDNLSDYRMIFVELVPEVARAIIGMRLQSVRWEEAGGMSQFYKAMCIYVPQLRADYDGNTGIVDCTAA